MHDNCRQITVSPSSLIVSLLKLIANKNYIFFFIAESIIFSSFTFLLKNAINELTSRQIKCNVTQTFGTYRKTLLLYLLRKKEAKKTVGVMTHSGI